jgi:hypothetical protein
VCVTGFYDFDLLLLKSYFKLLLQNITTERAIGKFYEQYFEINKVQCERQEWLQQHQIDKRNPSVSDQATSPAADNTTRAQYTDQTGLCKY